MNRPHAIVWGVLVGLTAVSFAGEALPSVRPGPGVLAGVAFVKVWLLGFRYMDLRHAHALWRVAYGGLASLVLAGLVILGR